MKEIVFGGGWVMLPLVVCMILALAIILERLWTLRRKKVLPPKLLDEVDRWARSRRLEREHLEGLRRSSPVGQILAAALMNRHRSRDIIKEAVEDTGRHVVHRLERNLNTLGTIAGITPLLGLLGTVIGMIKVFSSIVEVGVGDANQLAGGISEALITTAAGLIVAIPAYMFYRFFRGKVAGLVVEMEEHAIALIDSIDRAGTTGR